MKLYPRNKLPVREVRKFIIIFYVVGILGFLIPYSRDFFTEITPLALLLAAYLLGIYHNNWNKKTVLCFALIYLLGFSVEAAGVNTGLIFGHYTYGSGLGIKLLNTPLLIGLNWLFLTYTTLAIVEKFKIKAAFSIMLAPLLMLAYDFILEMVAPAMDMWSWDHASIPLKNYIAWYLLGLAFTGLLKAFKIRTQNPLALVLFVCQFAFFIFLAVFL
jgi:putative membrane protein